MEAEVTAECAESVLTHEALLPVERRLAEVPRFSRSPVERCLRIFKPCTHNMMVSMEMFIATKHDQQL